mgnify:CR=1 FL=1
MPTGYTADLHAGEPQTFPQFALACARNFGALILMRDDPPDAEIPDRFEPSTYYAEALEEAKARYDQLQAMTVEQADQAAAEAHAEAFKSWADSKAKAEAVVARYQAMRAEVEAWEPPTAEHQGLKEFMLSQLDESIRFDGSTWDQPTAKTGAEWLQAEKDRAYKNIGRYAEEQAKEIARAEQRTAWVRALRASLPTAVQA